jgi:hypothetical protein
MLPGINAPRGRGPALPLAQRRNGRPYHAWLPIVSHHRVRSQGGEEADSSASLMR